MTKAFPPPEADPAAAPLDASLGDDDALPFDPVPVRPRCDGWTAYRQRRFIAALAETGCVAEACESAGVTARSAYRLRLREGAESFAAAWERAQTLGLRQLVDIAYERATIGSPRGVWKDGRQIGTEYVPSDRLLMFLLAHNQPTRLGLS